MLQQFDFNPATDSNIKPIAGLRPATLFVTGVTARKMSQFQQYGDCYNLGLNMMMVLR